jgi:hypothetical protein
MNTKGTDNMNQTIGEFQKNAMERFVATLSSNGVTH